MEVGSEDLHGSRAPRSSETMGAFSTPHNYMHDVCHLETQESSGSAPPPVKAAFPAMQRIRLLI